MRIRCRLKGSCEVLAFPLCPFVAGACVWGAVYFAIYGDSAWQRIGLALFLGAGSAYLIWRLAITCAWVELDGETIREKNLWTRREASWPVADVDEIEDVETGLAGPIGTTLSVLGGRKAGYDIKVRGGRTIHLNLLDMTNVKEFMNALNEQLAKRNSENEDGQVPEP